MFVWGPTVVGAIGRKGWVYLEMCRQDKWKLAAEISSMLLKCLLNLLFCE